MTGFGYAVVAMSFMPFLLPFRSCSVISAFVIVVMGIQMTYLLRKHIDLRIIVVPLVSALLSTTLGFLLLMHFNEKTLKLILGVFLLVLSFYFIYTSNKKIKIKPGFINGALVGLLTGVTTGMFNIVGPFLLVYYFSATDDNMQFKANLEFGFLIAGLYTLLFHIKYGNINTEVIFHSIISGAAVLVAGFLGIKIFKRLDRSMLSKAIYTLMLVMGSLLIIKG